VGAEGKGGHGSGYVILYFLTKRIGGQAVITSYYDKTAQTAYEWMSFMSKKDIAWTMCEDTDYREQSKHDNISHKTLMKFAHLLVEELEGVIAEMLPDVFGIAHDGWTEAHAHFVSLWAICSKGRYCLAFSPMSEEEGQDADTHIQFFKDTLEIYDKYVPIHLRYLSPCFLDLCVMLPFTLPITPQQMGLSRTRPAFLF
jgi:hypothetical protein